MVVTAVIGIVLVGCGTGEDDSGSDAAGAAARIAQSCDADSQISAGMNELVVTTDALQTDDYDAAAVARALPKIQADYDRLVAPAVADLRSDPPAEIKADVEELAGKLKSFRDEGDTALFENQGASRVDAFYFENCPGSKSEIQGTEYKFDGATTFLPGQVRFKFSNSGQEFHHMVIFTKNAGVEESFDQLLQLPDDQSADKIHPVTGSGPVAPGGSSYLTGKLDPGQYAMVCFIAQGATPEKVGSGTEMFTENGKSHLDLGMKKELTVA